MKKVSKLSLIAFSCLYIYSSGHAQIKTYSDTTNILIGQPLKLFFEIENGNDLKFPSIKDSLEGFYVLKGFDTVNQTSDVYYVSLIVTKFDTGYFEFPELTFINDSDSIKSEKVGIYVMLPALNEQIEIFDIKDNISYYNDIWIAVVLLSIILMSLLYYILKKLKNKISHKNNIYQTQNLEQITIEKLNESLTKYINNILDGRMFYFEVDEIIRRYLERKYGYKFLEHTSKEVLKDLELLPISLSNMENIKAFVKTAELVKFAKSTDDKEKTVEMIHKIIQFIQLQEKL